MARSCLDLTCLRKSPLWSKLVQVHGNSFDGGQYLLGDSNYIAIPHLVCSFKFQVDIDSNKEAFNMCVAKARVTNEHCIDVLKSRWHSLKEIQSQLKYKSDNGWTVHWINVCAMLHNYVMSMHDDWTDQDQAIILDAQMGLPMPQ